MAIDPEATQVGCASGSVRIHRGPARSPRHHVQYPDVAEFILEAGRRPVSLDRVPAGIDVPNDCNVVIEIPMHGEPIKYEVDKATGAVFVDRFMSTAMHYPCNYGYIPQTLSDDGDPCDVLVISPVPLITGVVVRCRPIGMLKMDDEAGGDAKVLAVPIDRLSSMYRTIETPRDLPEIQLSQIAHFFEHYKDLEPGKWVRLAGWVGPEEAKREINDSVRRYRETAGGS